jgi:hypothetical protein
MRKTGYGPASVPPMAVTNAPEYLATPLQGILYNEAHARVVRAKRKDLYSFPAGQVVGMINEESSVRDAM